MKKIKMSPVVFCLLGISFLIFSGCNPLGKEKFKVEFKNPGAFKDLAAQVSNISVIDNQLVISGTTLGSVKTVTLKNDSQEEIFTVESASENQLVANGTRAISLIAGSVFDLILADAYGAATFQVTFSVSDGAITTAKIANGAVTSGKLDSMGAVAGQYLKYNGSNWVASSLIDGQNYLGTWNVATNTPDLTTPSSSPGDYYVISDAGTFSGVAYGVGDWIISDGYNWQKLPYSKTSVSSFQGRKGIVTLVPGDYVSLKDTGTGKITGSNLNDLANIDLTTVAPAAGNVLKYDGTKWVAGADNAGIASGSIVDADISGTADIAQSKISGLATSLSAKQDTTSLAADVRAIPLTGLSSTTGAVVAADTILGAFGKLLNSQGDYVSKSSGADIVTGTIAVSGTGMITIPTASGTTLTEAANVTYVTNAIAANGVWAKSGSRINYTGGYVGIGTTNPISNLEVYDGITPTTLTASCFTGDLTMTVASTAGYPTSGVLTVDSEVMAYTGTTETSFTGLTRGYMGTAATNHSSGRTVARYLFNVSNGTSMGLAVKNDGGVTIGGSAVGFQRTSALSVKAKLGSESARFENGDSAYSLHLANDNGTINSVSITAGSNSTGNNCDTISPAWRLNLNGYSDYFSLARSACGTASAGSTPIELLRVSSTGKLGVGTKSPSGLLSVNPSQYATGTASQSGTTITGVGTSFTSSLIGSQFVFANGVNAGQITAVPDATTLTVVTNQTVASQGYSVNYSGLNVSIAGNVGIGTASPVSTLDVVGGATFTTSNNPFSIVTGNAGQFNVLKRDTLGTAAISWNSSTQSLGLNAATDNSYGVAIGTNTRANALKVSGNVYFDAGNIGIGINTPEEKLEVNGNVKATAFLYNSDRNLKQSIEPLTNSLEKILRLNGYSYEWKSNSSKDIGVIAQEVEREFPELVATSSIGLKSVKYANLVAPIIESIKELYTKFMNDSNDNKRRISSHDVDIAFIKKENERLKSRIQAINFAKDLEIAELKERARLMEMAICELNPKSGVCTKENR